MNTRTSNTVWEDLERPQTLADKSWTPTSIDGVEFPDDKEPEVYRATRAAMHAVSDQELTDLRELNHQTAAYSTLPCVAPPLSPEPPVPVSGKPCEIASMQERSHAVTAYTPEGQPQFPVYQQEIQERCDAMSAPLADPKRLPLASGEPPIGKKIPYKRITSRMMTSVKGAVRDMKNFDQLSQTHETPEKVVYFVMTREERYPYLMLTLTVILTMLAIMSACRCG